MTLVLVSNEEDDQSTFFHLPMAVYWAWLALLPLLYGAAKAQIIF